MKLAHACKVLTAHISLLILSCIFISTTVKAEDKTAKTDVEVSEEVVVYGKQLDEVDTKIKLAREKHAGSISTVSPKEIEFQKASNLGEILVRIPGLTYVDEDGRGTKPDIGLRGLDPIRSQYVQLLHDGIPTQPSMYSEQAAYYGVPAERVSGIEVYKGGSSILFGPNTTGGVVNLISRSPSRDPFAAILDTRFDSYGDYLGNMFLSGTKGKVSYGLEYMHKGGEGFGENRDYGIDDLEATLAYKFNARHSVNAHFQYYDEVSETPGGLLPTQFQSDPQQSNKTHDEFFGKRIAGDIRTSHQLIANQRFETLFYSYYFQRNWFIQNYNNNNTTDVSLANSNGQFLRDFNVVGFEPKYVINYDLGSTRNNELTIGTRIYYDTVDRSSGTGNTGTSREDDAVLTSQEELGTMTYAAFIQNEFKATDRLSIVPGIRYEYIDQNRTNVLTNAAEETYNYDIFIPGLGIKYTFAKDSLVYANATRSFRPPTFSDSFNPATNASNFNLAPSTAWIYEGGIRANPHDWLFADLGVFYTDFKDQVVVSAGTAANFDTRAYGFESAVQLGLIGLSKAISNANKDYSGEHEIYFQVGATLVDSTFVGGSFDGNDLPNVPNETFTFGLLYEYGDTFNLGFQGRHTGARFTDNANTVQENSIGTIGELVEYTVFDLKSRFKISKQLSMNAGINNIFDEIYGTQRRTGSQKGIFTGPTRSFYISATLNY